MYKLKNLINERFKQNKNFFSIEIFPPKSTIYLEEFYFGLNKFLKQSQPLFCSITYHTFSQKQKNDPCSFFSIADKLVNQYNLNTVLHLTCDNKQLNEVEEFIKHANALNIENFLVLKGDNESKEDSIFVYANQMVDYLRKKHNHFFTIGVAGYPEKHPSSITSDDDIFYLKNKVDCGADYILTQIVYDADIFINFVEKCKNKKINIPVIAGIMPIQSYKSMIFLIENYKITVPKSVIEFLKENQNDEKKISKFAVDYAVEMCLKILNSKVTCGLHFYTLNNFEQVKNILIKLDLVIKTISENSNENSENNLSDAFFLFKKMSKI